MPATSARQRRFLAADLARLRAGERTRTTGMTEAELREFVRAPVSPPTRPSLERLTR